MLISAAALVDAQGCQPDFDPPPVDRQAYFARVAGVDGELQWTALREYACWEEGVAIAGLADGRAYGVVYSVGLLNEVKRGHVVAFDLDGSELFDREYGWPLYFDDIGAGPGLRLHVAGSPDNGDALYWELDPDNGDQIAGSVSQFGANLADFHRVASFDNGEVMLIDRGFTPDLVRLDADHQIVWSHELVQSNESDLDVGGPLERVVAMAEGELFMFEADGQLIWQVADKGVVAIDPNGDVLTGFGTTLEKLSGTDGSLIWSIELAGSVFDVIADSSGAPIVAFWVGDDDVIQKLAP